MLTLSPLPTLPNMFAHCLKCGAVLLINEEWHTGRCMECKQWAETLELVDAIIDETVPTGPIRYPNRDA